ncbi:MAG: hypothetical protein RR412_05265 [Burkholderiaceae bacterium]
MTLDDIDPHLASAQRARIASHAELQQAIDLLLAATRRDLRIEHHDLAALRLADSTRVEQLAKLLRSSPAAQIRLLANEIDWLETAAPRLRTLASVYSHALSMRQNTASDTVGAGATLIADDRSFVRLAATAYPMGELVLNEPASVRLLIDTFDDRWNAAGYDLPTRPLGL